MHSCFMLNKWAGGGAMRIPNRVSLVIIDRQQVSTGMPQRILQKCKTHKLTIALRSKKLKLSLTVFDSDCEIVYALNMNNQKNVPFWVHRKLGCISNLYDLFVSDRRKCFEVIQEKGVVRVFLDDDHAHPYILALKRLNYDKCRIDRNNFQFFADRLMQTRSQPLDAQDGMNALQTPQQKPFPFEKGEQHNQDFAKDPQGQQKAHEEQTQKREKQQNQKQNIDNMINLSNFFNSNQTKNTGQIDESNSENNHPQEDEHPVIVETPPKKQQAREAKKLTESSHFKKDTGKGLMDDNQILENPDALEIIHNAQSPQLNKRILRARHHKKQTKSTHLMDQMPYEMKQGKKDPKPKKNRNNRQKQFGQKLVSIWTPSIGEGRLHENGLTYNELVEKTKEQQHEINQLRSANSELKAEIKLLKQQLENEKRKQKMGERKGNSIQSAGERKDQEQSTQSSKREQWAISQLSKVNQNFVIEGLKVMRGQNKNMSDPAWSFLYFMNSINPSRVFTISIRIHKCLESNIGIGVTSLKNSYKSACWNDENCIEYVGFSRRVFESGNSRIQSGYGICEGDVIVMAVCLKNGLIEWRSERGTEATFQSKKLMNPKQIFVPFVRLKNYGDCIQVLNS